MASRDTPRGVRPVLRGVCANLLWKRSKAALSYSTPSPTPAPRAAIGKTISCASGASGERSKNERETGQDRGR